MCISGPIRQDLLRNTNKRESKENKGGVNQGIKIYFYEKTYY